MRYWLIKSEPYEFSIDDFSAFQNQTIAWEGVRNYQSRNFMRNQMAIGDQVFFYHSCCKDPGIMGIAVVSKPAYLDATQFNPDCKYFDPKAAINNLRWFNVEVTLVKGYVTVNC